MMSVLFHDIDGVQIKEEPQTWHSDSKSVKLTVNATGLGTLSYQWLKDGDDIDTVKYPNCSGIDTATLTITPFTLEYEGNYSCLVKDQTGQDAKSDPIEVKGSSLQYFKGREGTLKGHQCGGICQLKEFDSPLFEIRRLSSLLHLECLYCRATRMFTKLLKITIGVLYMIGCTYSIVMVY